MDNAATSFPKPRAVMQAMVRFATELGASPGRGVYREAIESAGILQECRKAICRLINGESEHHVIFTLNCTDALNLAIKGLVDPSRKGHAICTAIDHNSILRPLNRLEQDGWITQTRVPIDPATGLVDPQNIAKAIRSDTRLIAVSHGSNVSGTLQHVRQIGLIAREHAVPFIVDAAQSVGHVPIDVQADCIDLLAAPGHKALLGPGGTGFLYIRPGVEKVLRPLREGGTGSISDHPIQPDFMPDKYECGSHNTIGIAGLLEGVRWLLEQTVQKVHDDEMTLVRTFIEGVSTIEGLTYLGPQGVRDRIGVFSVRLEGYDPSELARLLESRYGILTRPGIHCAPLAHQTFNTTGMGGATRFSFGPFLSRQDVKYATDCLAELALAGR